MYTVNTPYKLNKNLLSVQLPAAPIESNSTAISSDQQPLRLNTAPVFKDNIISQKIGPEYKTQLQFYLTPTSTELEREAFQLMKEDTLSIVERNRILAKELESPHNFTQAEECHIQVLQDTDCLEDYEAYAAFTARKGKTQEAYRIYYALGKAYQWTNQFTKAKKFYSVAQTFCSKAEDTQNLAEANIKLKNHIILSVADFFKECAQLYVNQNNWAAAIDFYEKAYVLSKEKDLLEKLCFIYNHQNLLPKGVEPKKLFIEQRLAEATPRILEEFLDTIKFMESVGWKFPILNLSHNPNLTDIQFNSILKNINLIKILDLEGCIQLTDGSIYSLLTENVEELEEINLNMCSNISDGALNLLIDRAPCLKTIQLNDVPSLKLSTLQKLYARGIPFHAESICFTECLATLTGHSDTVTYLIQLTNGQLVSGSADTTIKLWNVDNGQCTTTLTGHTASIISMGQLEEDNLISVSLDKICKLWDFKKNQCVETVLLDNTDNVSSNAIKSHYHPKAALDPSISAHPVRSLKDGRVASAINRGTAAIKLSSQSSPRGATILEGHTDFVVCLLQLSNGWLASASKDSTIKLWII